MPIPRHPIWRPYLSQPVIDEMNRHAGAFTRAITTDMARIDEDYRRELYRQLFGTGVWPWPMFHLFPRLEKTGRRLSLYRYRCGLAVDVFLGRHDCGI